MDPDNQSPDESLNIGDNARIGGDVFTGGKHIKADTYIERAVFEGGAPPVTWADLRSRSQAQTRRSFGRLRAFIPELYLPRAALEAELAAFLSSPQAACILLGVAGSGKTSLLRHWAQALLEAGQAVYFYDCGGSVSLDVEREVVRDLLLDQVNALMPQLPRISQEAAENNGQVVLIFDAINEFRSSGDEGPDEFLKNIDALVERLPDANVRLVFSCNSTTWERLQRRDVTRLAWGRYYGSPDPWVRLPLFEAAELEQAYPRYQAYFHLKSPFEALPAKVREQLRNPLLLRLLAEAYRDKDEDIQHNALALDVYQRYFNERVRQRQDQAFVFALAAEMLSQKRGTLLLSELEQNQQFREAIVQEDKSTSYYRLLDAGLLTETSPGDLPIDTAVKFTYAQVGAYALAQTLLRQSPASVDVIATLLADARTFPLAYGTARVLLTLCNDAATLAALAQAPQVERRELTVESLVDLFADQPSVASAVIEQLLHLDSALAQRTALKAAYRIGEGARAHFLTAAVKGSPDLRAATRDTLYLIGQDSPQFVFGVLDDLASQISYKSPLNLPNILAFILDLSVTLYINQCEREGMIKQTSDLWHKVLRERLHLDRLQVLAPVVENVLIPAVSIGYAGRLVSTLTEFIPAEQLFKLSPEDKALFQRLAPYVDPQTALEPVAGDLAALLQSDILLFKLLGAMVLVVHAYRDFPAIEPWLRSLFEELPPTGRLFELLGFSLLLPDTPPAWVDLLEVFTRRMWTEHPAIVSGETPTILAKLDLLMLPLGLAYAKRGPDMPVFVSFIKDGLERGDQRQVARCLSGLAPLGFYYPQAVFQTLRAALPGFAPSVPGGRPAAPAAEGGAGAAAGAPFGAGIDPALEAPLVNCLATIRLLHLDAVDVFLNQIGASEAFQRQVAAAADVELVRRYIYALGIYNTSIHQALNYPKMRRQLLIGSLSTLADARNAQDFISRYSLVPIRMAREAGYQLYQWTLPE